MVAGPSRPGSRAGRDVLEHLRQIASAVEVPVNADFEGGYASDPDGVAENVELAAATGIAGLSIEDSTATPTSRSIRSTWPSSGFGRRAGRSTKAARTSFSPVAPRGSSSAGPTSTRRSAGCRRTPRPAPTASTHRSSTARAGVGDRLRRGTEAGEPARLRSRSSRSPTPRRSASADQPRRLARPRCVGRVHGRRTGDRRPRHVRAAGDLPNNAAVNEIFAR